MNRLTNTISARLLSRRSGAAYNALPKGTPNPLGLTRGRRATVIAQNLFNQLSKELHSSANTSNASEQPCPLGKAGSADNSLSFHIASPFVRRHNVLNIVRNQVSSLYIYPHHLFRLWGCFRANQKLPVRAFIGPDFNNLFHSPFSFENILTRSMWLICRRLCTSTTNGFHKYLVLVHSTP